MLYGYIIIYSLVLILLGYGLGRRYGVKEGVSNGIKRQRLIDRSLYFEKKVCPICYSTHQSYRPKARSKSEEVITSIEF